MVIKNMGQTCSVCKSLLLHPVKQSIRLNLGVCKMPANDTVRSSCGNLQGLSTASFKYTWDKEQPFPKRCNVKSQEESTGSLWATAHIQTAAIGNELASLF